MVVGLWFGASRVSAQTTITLVEYTNVWKYSATGTDLGTGWRSNSFDDSAWPSGRGILGVESVPAIYTRALFNTTFSNFTPATITYYFRTHFNFPTNPCGVTLMASNYIDDGAVIFLNGVEMARFRVPIDQTAGTFASAPGVGAYMATSFWPSTAGPAQSFF